MVLSKLSVPGRLIELDSRWGWGGGWGELYIFLYCLSFLSSFSLGDGLL